MLHDPTQVDAIRREAEVLAQLRHPNLTQLIQADLQADPPFLVTELLEGAPLSDLLPVSTDDAWAISRQILAGLAHAHHQGIAHLDLKPSNVMVQRLDRGWCVKIADFGLGRVVGHSAPGLEHSFLASAIGTYSGTLAYMSPEQREGKPGDERSDVFSFGVLLCEMLTGRRPQPGDTLADLLGHPAPAWAQAVFDGCYTRYDRRFTQAGAVLDALVEADQPPKPIVVRAQLRPSSRQTSTGSVLFGVRDFDSGPQLPLPFVSESTRAPRALLLGLRWPCQAV